MDPLENILSRAEISTIDKAIREKLRRHLRKQEEQYTGLKAQQSQSGNFWEIYSKFVWAYVSMRELIIEQRQKIKKKAHHKVNLPFLAFCPSQWKGKKLSFFFNCRKKIYIFIPILLFNV
jgi:hypothetical protein